MLNFRNSLLLLAASLATLAAPRFARMHQAGPQPGHTGAFGEPTCRACHFDYDLNEAPAALIRLDSLPADFERGKSYTLVLSVQHPELKRAGFQLTARFADGTQAGSFELLDTTSTRVQDSAGITYLSHATRPVDRWTFRWSAPAAPEPVIFSAAINVSNADASEFGDRIYTTSFRSQPRLPKK